MADGPWRDMSAVDRPVLILSHHFYLTLSSLAQNNQTRWIQNLLSLTYKVLKTTKPLYLHNLISVQPPRSTRFSSFVIHTLARRPTSSSLRITDRSFRYSPYLWNQLSSSFRQPHSSSSVSDLPVHAPTTSTHSCQLTTLAIHNSFCLSLPAQDLPLSQIFPTICSLQS